MKRKNVIISIGLGILVFILIYGGYAVAQFFSKPQAPPLSLVSAKKIEVKPSPTSIPGVQISPTSEKVAETATSVTPIATPKNELQVKPTVAAPVCGLTGNWTILVLGRSTRIEHEGTQTIRLVKVSFDQKSVLIYSFPPHLALDTPGLVTDYNIQYAYLEEIFPKVVKAVGESDQTDFKATQALAQVILDSFGIPIDHYMTIQDNVLLEAVDALGGIYVNVSEDFTIPENSSRKGEVIKAGLQHFDGEMLRAYASAIGENEDEFARLARQNAILEGIRKKMLNPSTLLKIIELYSIYKEYVVTDLSLEQMTSLGCLARLVSRDQIIMKEPSADEILYLEDGAMQFKNLASTAQQLQILFGVSQP